MSKGRTLDRGRTPGVSKRELGDTLGADDNAEVSTDDANGGFGGSSGVDGASDTLGAGPHGWFGAGPCDMLGEGARGPGVEKTNIGIEALFGRVVGGVPELVRAV
ncbi:unnamed protein product [Ilex paraguariensis]|uniref:Uncharacterized protein n=1 Tax=Ilex paraguariensis TaxID=185542 RepID=A0ABC8RCN3_9AQUA